MCKFVSKREYQQIRFYAYISFHKIKNKMSPRKLIKQPKDESILD